MGANDADAVAVKGKKSFHHGEHEGARVSDIISFPNVVIVVSYGVNELTVCALKSRSDRLVDQRLLDREIDLRGHRVLNLFGNMADGA